MLLPFGVTHWSGSQSKERDRALEVEFGGHHLGLNIVLYGVNGIMTPTLTGAQPAVYTDADSKTVRALADENDKSFVLPMP